MILDGVKLAVGEEKKLDSILIVNAKELNCGLREWAGKVATQEGRRIPEEVPTGWNDWQFYRNEKTQEDVLDSADVVEEFKRAGYPLDYVQIDGGFCLHLSEWSIPKPEFSMGIKELSEKIISKGLKFGLWFAPYIQNVNTEVVKQHPEWLLKNEQGEPVCLGNSNVGESYLIDYTVPGTIKWLKEQIHLFSSEWNVTWIKLDGPNYALYRRGKLSDRSLTIHEMLLKTFNVMREVVGDDVLIEGEGPMGLALGEVELHRVQTDNHPVWYRGNDVRQPYAPCVYGKELSMAFLHNIWWCNHRENVVLRDYPSPFCSAKAYNKNAVEQIFTENELQTQLVSTVMSPAGFLLTDPLKELLKTPNRVNYIHQLLPVWRQPADIVDAFPFDGRYPSIYKTKVTLQHEEYFLLSVFNWNDNTKDFVVPIEKIVDDNEAEYYGFSFFENSIFTFKNTIEIKNVSAHGVKLFALRRKKEVPQLLSTDMHFTQGAVDIDSHLWEVERSCLRIRAKHFYQINKKIFLRVPENWQMVNIKSNAEKIHINDFDRENQVIIFNGSKEKHTDIALFFKNTIDH
jgi:alpha-galactosidase